MKALTVAATLKVALKPWNAPNFAARANRCEGSEGASVPVADLDDDALESMALAWLADLYHNAGRRCPFHALPKQAPRRFETVQGDS